MRITPPRALVVLLVLAACLAPAGSASPRAGVVCALAVEGVSSASPSAQTSCGAAQVTPAGTGTPLDASSALCGAWERPGNVPQAACGTVEVDLLEPTCSTSPSYRCEIRWSITLTSIGFGCLLVATAEDAATDDYAGVCGLGTGPHSWVSNAFVTNIPPEGLDVPMRMVACVSPWWNGAFVPEPGMATCTEWDAGTFHLPGPP